MYKPINDASGCSALRIRSEMAGTSILTTVVILSIAAIFILCTTGTDGYVDVTGNVGRAGYSTCQLENGRCTYHVQLFSGCDVRSSNMAASDVSDLPQGDQTTERVKEIEKNLVEVRVDHTRRLADLENTISAMLGQASPAAQPQGHLPGVVSHVGTSSS